MTTAILEAAARLGAALLVPFTRPLLRLGMAALISLAVAVPGGLAVHALGSWFLGALVRLVRWLLDCGWRFLAWAGAWVLYLQRGLIIVALSLLLMMTLFAHLVRQEELLDGAIDGARGTGAALWALVYDGTWTWPPLPDVYRWPATPRLFCAPRETVMVRGHVPPDAPPRPRDAADEDEEWLATVDRLRTRQRAQPDERDWD